MVSVENTPQSASRSPVAPVVNSSPAPQALNWLEPSSSSLLLTQEQVIERAEALHNAIDRWNTDEDAIFNALALTSKLERDAIAQVYQERYKQSLRDAIISVTSRGDQHLALALLDKGSVDRLDLLKFATDRVFTDKALLSSLFEGLSKGEISALESTWVKQGGAAFKAIVTSSLSGDQKFDALLALEGSPETVEEMIAQLDRRVKHERSGLGGFFIDLFSDKGKNLEALQAQLHAEYETRRSAGTLNSKESQIALTQLASAAFESAVGYRSLRDTVAKWTTEILATAAIVVVSIAAFALSAPLWVVFAAAAAVSLAVRAGVNYLFQGDGYGSDELMSDAGSAVVDGATALVPAAARGWVLARTAVMAEKTVLQCALKGAVQGAILGGISGGSREGISSVLSQKTWKDGIFIGVGSVAADTARGLALGAVLGAPLGFIQGGMAKFIQPLQRGDLRSWVGGAKEAIFGGSRVMVEESGQLTFFNVVTKQLGSLSSSAGGVGGLVSALLNSSRTAPQVGKAGDRPLLIGAVLFTSAGMGDSEIDRVMLRRRAIIEGRESITGGLPVLNQKTERLAQLVDEQSRIHAHQIGVERALKVNRVPNGTMAMITKSNKQEALSGIGDRKITPFQSTVAAPNSRLDNRSIVDSTRSVTVDLVTSQNRALLSADAGFMRRELVGNLSSGSDLNRSQKVDPIASYRSAELIVSSDQSMNSSQRKQQVAEVNPNAISSLSQSENVNTLSSLAKAEQIRAAKDLDLAKSLSQKESSGETTVVGQVSGMQRELAKRSSLGSSLVTPSSRSSIDEVRISQVRGIGSSSTLAKPGAKLGTLTGANAAGVTESSQAKDSGVAVIRPGELGSRDQSKSRREDARAEELAEESKGSITSDGHGERFQPKEVRRSAGSTTEDPITGETKNGTETENAISPRGVKRSSKAKSFSHPNSGGSNSDFQGPGFRAFGTPINEQDQLTGRESGLQSDEQKVTTDYAQELSRKRPKRGKIAGRNKRKARGSRSQEQREALEINWDNILLKPVRKRVKIDDLEELERLEREISDAFDGDTEGSDGLPKQSGRGEGVEVSEQSEVATSEISK